MVAVAQLVEPRLVVPVVAGSSPVSHPKESREKWELAPTSEADAVVDARSAISRDGSGVNLRPRVRPWLRVLPGPFSLRQRPTARMPAAS